MPLCKKWYKMHVCKFPIWKNTYKTWDIGDKHVWMWWWKAQGRYQRRYLVYGLSKSTMVNHWWIIGTYWSKNELIAVTKISPTWKVQPTNNGKYHKSMEVWKWLLYGKWLPIVIKIHYHSTKNYIWSYLPLPEMVFTINSPFIHYGHGLWLIKIHYPIGSMYAIEGNIYHQYTPFMLAYIPAPWIRHGYGKIHHFCIGKSTTNGHFQ